MKLRINQLQEKDLVERMNTIRSTIIELKNRQVIGADNVIIKRISSDDTWDYTVINITGIGASIIVEFIPDNTLEDLGFAYKLEYLSLASVEPVQRTIQRLRIGDDARQQWLIYIAGSDISPVEYVKFKFHFLTVNPGTFTVTAN